MLLIRSSVWRVPYHGHISANNNNLVQSCSYAARWLSNLSSPSALPKHRFIDRGVITIRDEVRNALQNNEPVVALESTLISHGLPYPTNVQTALDLEAVVRKAGAVPATIAVLNGKAVVGCSPEEIETIAKAGPSVLKTSRRDLAVALASGGLGATTVSGTMVLAHKCGIKMMATGGIGGVHRGGQDSLDISADLTELGRTPVTVVCSGIKSILDIPRTLECLETKGVTTVAFSDTKDFPAFYSRNTGGAHPSQAMLNTTCTDQAARIILANSRLGLRSGMVFAVPIPEAYAQDAEEYERIVNAAVQCAEEEGISGAAITPFLLSKISEITNGNSMEANIALLKNNAQVCSEISVALHRLQQNEETATEHIALNSSASQPDFYADAFDLMNGCNVPQTEAHLVKCASNSHDVVLVGGSTADFLATFDNVFKKGTKQSGTIREVLGGVARNVAEGLCRLGLHPLLITAAGSDAGGNMLLDSLSQLGMSREGVLVSNKSRTPTCATFMAKSGELVGSISEMKVLGEIDSAYLANFSDSIRRSKMVCLDGNIRGDTFKHACTLCEIAGVPVWFEPTSVEKSTLPIEKKCMGSLSYVSPNVLELKRMANCLRGLDDSDWSDPNQAYLASFTERLNVELLGNFSSELSSHSDIIQDSLLLLKQGIKLVVTTMGSEGCLAMWRATSANSLKPATLVTIMKARKHDSPVNVSGAGDSLVAGTIAGLLKDQPVEEALTMGMLLADMSIESFTPISNLVSDDQTSWDFAAKKFGSEVVDITRCIY